MQSQLQVSRKARYDSPIGSEQSKLENTISRMVRKPKVPRNGNKKEDNSNSVSRDESEAGTSVAHLPYLSKSFNNENMEESRLMGDIRKVENKIKGLRFERDQFGNQQSSFDMIRPFLEVQNQNMVNLQMMILAQNKNPCHMSHNNQNNQNNNQNNNCCNASRGREVEIRYMPYEGHHSHKRHHRRHRSRDSSPSSSEYDKESERSIMPQQIKRASKKMKMKLKPKKYNMAKLRKFRVAVIAVYFSLLFPKYANCFTKKRFVRHR